MRKLSILILLASFLLSCSKKEDPIERERKEMKEFFDNSKLLVAYKGVKIALRVDYANPDAQNVKMGETGLKTLSAIAGLLTKDTLHMSVTGLYDTYQQVKGLYELKKEINQINEDELPTIFSKFSSLEKTLSNSSTVSSALEKDIFGAYNNSTEHFILGSLWFVTPSAPADIYIYEAAHIDNSQITKADQHVFACLLKALVCNEKEWYYTSEKSSSTYIDYISSHKKEVLESTTYLDSLPSTDPEKRFYELRSLGYALRAYSKEKSDREDEANKDYDLFVDDFDKADIKNKEMCFLSSYICIKNSKNDKAERFLKKMEQSNGYNEKDKETVAELRAFIKNKDDKKFNKYFDNFSLSKIAFSYLYNLSVNSDMAKQLQANSYSKKLVAMPNKVNNVINYSETLLNTDSLASSAGKLIKGLFK